MAQGELRELLTIKEGFEHLTKQRKWYTKCRDKEGEPLIKNRSSAGSLKRIFKEGTLSETTMIRLLESAGYTIIPPKCILPDNEK